MNKWNVGVVGCTGMVGQRFFDFTGKSPLVHRYCIGSKLSQCRKPYQEAVRGRWKCLSPFPSLSKKWSFYDAVSDRVRIAEQSTLSSVR